MSKSVSISTVSVLLLSATILSSQQTQSAAPQTGQPAQPSSSVYGRMRRIPPSQTQQPTTQAQQFPTPARQFPPDQTAPATPEQRSPITFPHPPAPSERVNPQPQVSAPGTQQQPTTSTQPANQQVVSSPPHAPAGAEQQQPNPPRVSYMGGLLTVAAENATLADILKAVGTVTHASLEGTQPDMERVFGQFGPAAPRQVLNSILNGTRYDFILVGSVDDPGSVERIMLSSKGAAPAVRGSAGQIAARQNVPTPTPDEEQDNDVAGQPEIQQPPPPPVPSEQVQPPVQQQQQQVKTPEQLLQELQRLRQQQQQQTQQQGNVPR